MRFAVCQWRRLSGLSAAVLAKLQAASASITACFNPRTSSTNASPGVRKKEVVTLYHLHCPPDALQPCIGPARRCVWRCCPSASMLGSLCGTAFDRGS